MNKTMTSYFKCPFGKYKPKCYFDEIAHKKKFIPGTGAYTTDGCFSIIFKPPASGKKY